MNDQLISSSDPIGSHTLQVIAKADKFNRWMYAEFRSFLKGEILEIGSGIGNISELVIKGGFNITLSDYNFEYCEWLQKKYSDLNNVKNIIQIDLLHPDFQNHYSKWKEKFDTVFLLNVIEHLSDDNRAIANCHFMIRPNGHLVILAPAYQWLYCRLDKELGHFRRYSSTNMKILLKKEYFNIIGVKHFNFLAIPGWFFSGKILRRKKIASDEMAAFNKLVPFAKLLDKLAFKKIGLSIIVMAVKN